MLDYIALPLSLGLAAVAAWTDWRTGKIPNRLIEIGLILTLEFYVLLGLWLALGGPGQSALMRQGGPLDYLGAVALNGALAFLVSLLLWWVGVWAAGDAKLFSLLAFALPLGFYGNNYLPGLPSFVLFFNTFLCLMVVLLLELALKLALRAREGRRWRAARALLAASLASLAGRGWGLLRIVGGFVAIFMMIRISRHFARDLIDGILPMNRTLLYVVLFLAFTPLVRVLSRPRVFAGACVAIAGYLTYAFGFSADPALRSAVVEIGWMSLSIVALGWLYRSYTDFAEVRSLPVREVRPGMLLSESYLRGLRDNSQFNNERMGTQGPDGLNDLQVETLLTWHRKSHPEGEEASAQLATTVPFAPAMLLAVVLTALFQGYALRI